ncbi:prephenate dehydratase domain-containing protein [Coxiella-like endosymbiont]|uniref:prephenate dehydratase domain-containing protein n=1 Tax=Coxiella-like endosymbiont TaxID=1592897 RepID=UPI00272B6BF8|nr:prephenate dehydratase domain-containing protein [Coxiella-like endosymbiont]
MFHIPVSQNLITFLRISIKQITEIHSHRQALCQCREFLTTHFVWGAALSSRRMT